MKILKRVKNYLVGEGDLLLTEGVLADIERESLLGLGGSGEKDILFFEEGIRSGLKV